MPMGFDRAPANVHCRMLWETADRPVALSERCGSNNSSTIVAA